MPVIMFFTRFVRYIPYLCILGRHGEGEHKYCFRHTTRRVKRMIVDVNLPHSFKQFFTACKLFSTSRFDVVIFLRTGHYFDDESTLLLHRNLTLKTPMTLMSWNMVNRIKKAQVRRTDGRLNMRDYTLLCEFDKPTDIVRE